MSRHDVHRALRSYPSSWRRRYGDELAAFLDDEYEGALPISARRSLVVGGIVERLRSCAPRRILPATLPTRGPILVFVAFAGFVIAGSSFAKFSEHFDEALPRSAGTHAIADVAFVILQGLAAVSACAVLAGAVLALPAGLRLLRARGWEPILPHVRRAVVMTGLTGGMLVGLAAWAHNLSNAQRNGGWVPYELAFLAFCAAAAVSIGLWTAAVVAVGRRIELAPSVLWTEALLGTFVGVAMLGMIAATATWWAAMALHAPVFISSRTGGPPLDAWLVGSVALMAVSSTIGIAGASISLRDGRHATDTAPAA